MERALHELRALSRGAFRASSLWRTSPVDCPPESADFVNAAAAFLSDVPVPETLLAELKAMERRQGRASAPVRNAPRELDLDLLLFGDVVRDTKTLTLPHPRALSRRFVMTPAAEVAPDWHWPGVRGTIAEIARALRTDETLARLPRLRNGAAGRR